MEMSVPIETVDREENRRQDFTQKVVYKLLSHGRVLGRVRQFKAEKLAQTGSSQLTLPWFHRRFPGFPVRLGATLVPNSKSPPWPDLFQRFTKTDFFRAYQQWREEQEIDDHRENAGLVFNLDTVTFVLHNLTGTAKPSRMRAVRILGQPPVTFVIEEFSALLGSIGNSWAQDSYLE
jgi:hypothetical protein